MQSQKLVYSRHFLERVCPEAAGLFGPCFTNELVWSEALEGLESASEVVGRDEVGKARLTMLYRSTDRLCRRGAPMENLAHSASFDSELKGAPSKPGIKHRGLHPGNSKPKRFTQHLSEWEFDLLTALSVTPTRQGQAGHAHYLQKISRPRLLQEETPGSPSLFDQAGEAGKRSRTEIGPAAFRSLHRYIASRRAQRNRCQAR